MDGRKNHFGVSNSFVLFFMIRLRLLASVASWVIKSSFSPSLIYYIGLSLSLSVGISAEDVLGDLG